MQGDLYIGLMSGTSMDSIDAVLTRINDQDIEFLAHHNTPWPEKLQQNLRKIAKPGQGNIEQFGTLDHQAAECFSTAATRLLEAADIQASAVSAIGSHGQTIRHRPEATTPFTIQIGDPSLIAERTGITVVADFRRRDMAAGGEGAPLVPAFHAAIFGNREEERVILNLGGIANISRLPAGGSVAGCGFDTGPANTLLDYWTEKHLGAPRDENGAWAAAGRVDGELLNSLLSDSYFQREPPKSTGPEYFSAEWLEQRLKRHQEIGAQDIQATLTALTAASITEAIRTQSPNCDRVIACGGGVNNGELMRQLALRLDPLPVESSDAHGIHPDHVEAMAFAWLARQTLHHLPGNLPSATGAKRAVVLGGIYPA
ncbi:MAG: anhydro-N-acetylmuramic acid kinase [Candidatus Sedimenticola sp. 6PFRAG7]